MGAGTNQLAPVCMVGPRTLERLGDSKRTLSRGSEDRITPRCESTIAVMYEKLKRVWVEEYFLKVKRT